MLLSLAACLALVVAGCGADTAEPTEQGVTSVRVALFRGGSTLPVQAALKKGIFERNGLRVEVTEGQDLPIFMAALAKGQYDIVMSGPTLVLVGVEKGLDLQVISSLQRSSQERPNAVWITKDPAIDSLDQLRGKTIAVPALTGIIADATDVPFEPTGWDATMSSSSNTVRHHGRSVGGRPCGCSRRIDPL